jgi:hypothetical protein
MIAARNVSQPSAALKTKGDAGACANRRTRSSAASAPEI